VQAPNKEAAARVHREAHGVWRPMKSSRSRNGSNTTAKKAASCGSIIIRKRVYYSGILLKKISSSLRRDELSLLISRAIGYVSEWKWRRESAGVISYSSYFGEELKIL
jgi:hypothetical protein